jgi:hypothetical protein
MNSKIPRHFATQLRVLIENGASMDEAVASIKHSGASICECIIAFKEHTRCDLAKAKQEIEGSSAWKDIAERSNKEWDQLSNLNDK